MLNIIFLKRKINFLKDNKNNTFFLQIAKINEISLYINVLYIKLKVSNSNILNSKHNESYFLKNKKNKFFNLIKTHFSTFYLKDNLFRKTLLLNSNLLFSNYTFTKNIIIPRHILLYINHRHITDQNTILLLNNKISISNKLNNFYYHKTYIFLLTYYNYWKNIFSNKLYYNFFKGCYFKKKSTSKFTISVKDITSGLMHIEFIFESRKMFISYKIPLSLSILINLFISYEANTSNYIWTYTMFNLNIKKLIIFSTINTNPTHNYEYNTAILLPNNILNSGSYSINNLILKLFFNNLNYYVQDQSIKISYIFIFNLIVESLTKQYFKNGIIIPSIQFELIVKKMTSFVKINYIGNSSLKENDIFEFNKLEVYNYVTKLLGYESIFYLPIVLGISKSILASSGFLSSISFQEIIKYLIKLSLENSTDWLVDFKSKVIATDVIKTGSGWYRYFIKI